MSHHSKVVAIVDALGGIENIHTVEPCVTRLRFEVTDPSKVDSSQLRQPLCFGASVVGTAVQVIVGPAAERLADHVLDLYDTPHSD